MNSVYQIKKGIHKPHMMSLTWGDRGIAKLVCIYFTVN